MFVISDSPYVNSGLIFFLWNMTSFSEFEVGSETTASSQDDEYCSSASTGKASNSSSESKGGSDRDLNSVLLAKLYNLELSCGNITLRGPGLHNTLSRRSCHNYSKMDLGFVSVVMLRVCLVT